MKSNVTVYCSSIDSIEWKKTSLHQLRKETTTICRVSVNRHRYIISQLSSLLQPDEVARSARFLKEKDKERFIISRAALRLSMGHYLSISPASVSFKTGKNGKPFVDHTVDKPLCFNVSHSGDWVLLAIGNHELGVDIEKIDLSFPIEDIVGNFFSMEESLFIQNAQNSFQEFYQLWTRKEALLKATSVGLTNNLSGISCVTGIHLIEDKIIGSQQNWQVNSFQIDPNHIGSVAIQPGVTLEFLDFDLQ